MPGVVGRSSRWAGSGPKALPIGQGGREALLEGQEG